MTMAIEFCLGSRMICCKRIRSHDFPSTVMWSVWGGLEAMAIVSGSFTKFKGTSTDSWKSFCDMTKNQSAIPKISAVIFITMFPIVAL